MVIILTRDICVDLPRSSSLYPVQSTSTPVHATDSIPHDLHHICTQVPLMMEDGYRSKGWLGMLLGVRLWYGFYGATLESDGAFEGKVDELCRELGERGKER